jgi:hypothetical protein
MKPTIDGRALELPAGAIFVPFVKPADSAANFLTNVAHGPVSKIPECAGLIEPLPA